MQLQWEQGDERFTLLWREPFCACYCSRSLGGNRDFKQATNGSTPFFYTLIMINFSKATFALLLLLSAVSCKNNKVDMGDYMAERDSIIQENKTKTQQLNELNGIITTIATGLDSIALQENILFTNQGRDGVKLDRHQIAANLNHMAYILAQQRKKIQRLQDSVANRSWSESQERLQKVVEFLN